MNNWSIRGGGFCTAGGREYPMLYHIHGSAKVHYLAMRRNCEEPIWACTQCHEAAPPHWVVGLKLMRMGGT